MQIQPELKSVLKRLRLSGILATLPDRWAYARQEKLDYPQFLELVLSDEVERRDHKNLTNRLQDAGFEEECTLERFDWSAKIRIDKARLTGLFGLHFIERHENVIFCGPVGVGKSFWAQALGHAACRAGYRVLFIRNDRLLKTLASSRADNSRISRPATVVAIVPRSNSGGTSPAISPDKNVCPVITVRIANPS